MTSIMTPTELSRKAGISVPYAWQILKGDRIPSERVAVKIFRSTGMKFPPIDALTDVEIAVVEKMRAQA